jgi:hypothetical protein
MTSLRIAFDACLRTGAPTRASSSVATLITAPLGRMSEVKFLKMCEIRGCAVKREGAASGPAPNGSIWSGRRRDLQIRREIAQSRSSPGTFACRCETPSQKGLSPHFALLETLSVIDVARARLYL